MNRLRPILGLLVAAAGIWLLVAIFSPGDGEKAPARTFTSSAQCGECHPREEAEWQASQHAMSWTNPAVRMLSNDFANQDCIDCHAPRPVFVTGIGKRVLPRTVRRRAGVDCIACHQLPDEQGGGMAGSLDDPTAPCRPAVRVELTRPDFCAGCHNQHKTVDQWRESPWFEKGEDCLSCHMPFRDDDPDLGRDHTFPGGNDLGMLKRAVELRGAREQDGWVIELENVGAGHAFPTDERSRRADLFWREAGGSGPWRHLHRIRDPYRYETDIPSTLLHAGETLRREVAEAGGLDAIEVALYYKRSPYWEDPEAPDPEREATLVHRIDLVR